MTAIKSIITLAILLLNFMLFAQEKRTAPKHPKGTESAQLKALVFYNKACDFYQEGKLSEAKMELKRAINTSFALTEAQLFLGDIYRAEGIKDSALLFYVSGVDFVPQQEPHYYFQLMNLAMDLGQYDLVKRYAKMFKRIHFQSVSWGRYEENYPYTVSDFVQLEESVQAFANYKTWQPEYRVKSQERIDQDFQDFLGHSEGFWIYKSDQGLVIDGTSPETKSQSSELTLSFDPGEVCLARQQRYLMVTNVDQKRFELFEKNSGEWKVIGTVPVEVDSADWFGTPFYDDELNMLFFSARIGGQKDLYGAQYWPEKNETGQVKSLDRINTRKDECFPSRYDGTFYFSSNGYPGFGGFDIQRSENSEVLNGFFQPANPFVMKSGVNSNQDEWRFWSTKDQYWLWQTSQFPSTENTIKSMDPIQKEKPFHYELRMQEIN